MNINFDPSDWVFLIVVLLAMVGILIVIIGYGFVLKPKRRKQAEEYLLSRAHAKTIALRISCRRHSWMDTEDGKAYIDGPNDVPFPDGHLFCESVLFRKEGISASVVMKDRKYLVGIRYKRDREVFAKKVADILYTEHRMNTMLKPR